MWSVGGALTAGHAKNSVEVLLAQGLLTPSHGVEQLVEQRHVGGEGLVGLLPFAMAGHGADALVRGWRVE